MKKVSNLFHAEMNSQLVANFLDYFKKNPWDNNEINLAAEKLDDIKLELTVIAKINFLKCAVL